MEGIKMNGKINERKVEDITIATFQKSLDSIISIQRLQLEDMDMKVLPIFHFYLNFSNFITNHKML